MENENLDKKEYDENIPFENITGRETEGLPALKSYELYDPSAESFDGEGRIIDLMEMTEVEARSRNNALRKSGLDLRWIIKKNEHELR